MQILPLDQRRHLLDRRWDISEWPVANAYNYPPIADTTRVLGDRSIKGEIAALKALIEANESDLRNVFPDYAQTEPEDISDDVARGAYEKLTALARERKRFSVFDAGASFRARPCILQPELVRPILQRPVPRYFVMLDRLSGSQQLGI